MTDEQYIEFLAQKNLDQRQINQLLKIYTYTKPYNFIITNIDSKIDVDDLRRIVAFLKENKLSNDYYAALHYGQKQNLDILPFLMEKYDVDVMRMLLVMDEKGKNIIPFRKSAFNKEQMEIIKEHVLENVEGMDIYCSNPEYSADKMSKIACGLYKKVILENYINLDDYDYYQCDSLADIINRANKEPGKIDLEIIKNPNLDSLNMLQIAELMLKDLPYKLLTNKEYEPIARELYIEILERTENKLSIENMHKYLSAENKFNYLQALAIMKIVNNENFNADKYDYDKIFNCKNNHYKIQVLSELSNADEIDFLNKIIDKNIGAERLVELFKIYKLGENIESLYNKTAKELLLFKRNLQLNKAGKSLKNIYKEIKKPDKNTPKYKIQNSYLKNQFFQLEDGNYIELVPLEDNYKNNYLGEVYDYRIDLEEFLNKNKDIIIDALKNSIIVSHGQKKDLTLYNVHTKEVVGHLPDNRLNKYLFNDDETYDFLHEEMTEDWGFILRNGFDLLVDLLENSPQLSNKIKVFIFGNMAETLYYIVTEKDIKQRYGEINEETLALAQKEFKDNCEYFQAQEDVEIYKCILHTNSESIESELIYYGDLIIDNLEKNYGKIVKDMGTFTCIDELKKSLNSASLDER